MNEIITSAGNSTVKQLRKLVRSSKERREANLYVAEGIHLAQSFLASGRLPNMYLHSVSAQMNHEVAGLIEELSVATVKRMIVSDGIFESISSIDASSGICIVFEPLEVAVSDILPLTKNAILLENIQDPGNLGTILRTAAAVGVKYVLTSSDCTSAWSPKALRAGMGAQFNLTIYERLDLTDVLRTAGIPVAATVLTSDSMSLYSLDLHQPIAWLFGSEGQGISEELASATTIKITIPQEANSVESLNVASAAAVCLYEQYRQNISQ